MHTTVRSSSFTGMGGKCSVHLLWLSVRLTRELVTLPSFVQPPTAVNRPLTTAKPALCWEQSGNPSPLVLFQIICPYIVSISWSGIHSVPIHSSCSPPHLLWCPPKSLSPHLWELTRNYYQLWTTMIALLDECMTWATSRARRGAVAAHTINRKSLSIAQHR